MNNFGIKFRRIFIPFLLLAFICIVGLLLFRYLIDLQFHVFTFKEIIWSLWIPAIVPGIPVLFWLRPKTRILGFSGDRDKGLSFFQMICWATISVTAIIAQNYMVEATSKVQKYARIDSVMVDETTSYFELDRFSVDTSFLSYTTDVSVSGKNNENLNFNLYFVFPFMREQLIGESPDSSFRYAIKFHKGINNRDSEDQKRLAYDQFEKSSWASIRSYDFDKVHLFKRTRPSDNLDFYREAATKSNFGSEVSNLIFLEPQQSSFDDRLGNLLPWSFGAFGIGLTILIIMLLSTGFDKPEYKRQLAGRKSAPGDVEQMLQFLVPQKSHFITSILVDLILLVFFAMIFSGIDILSPRTHQLMTWGANRLPEVIDGEWWRLITSMFLHGGLGHMISNIVGLVLAGIFVEPLLGRKNYLVVYLIAGITGSIISIAWHEQSASVGASGAILGLYGALLGLALLKKLPDDTRKLALSFAGLFIAVNLLYGLTGGIDNAAHIGGLIGGLLSGIILYKPGEEEISAMVSSRS
jgi:rhomboid protease GluP